VYQYIYVYSSFSNRNHGAYLCRQIYNYILNLYLRAISVAAGSEPTDQFVHLVKTVNVVSENQAQLAHVVQALQDKDKMRDCEDSEEKEGRMNCDLLNRFVVIGGPFFEPGPNLQSKLQEQVLPACLFFVRFQAHFISLLCSIVDFTDCILA
jgi:hypothetical protein